MSRRVQYDDKGKKEEENAKKMIKPNANSNNPIGNSDFNPNMSSYSFKDEEHLDCDAVRSLPTHEYLQSTVVKALSEGMFRVSQAKPGNPIEYLGRFLLEQSKANKQQMRQSNKN